MFVTNWISTTKIQKISEITNFFRHYFLSRTEVYYAKKHEKNRVFIPSSPYLFPFLVDDGNKSQDKTIDKKKGTIRLYRNAEARISYHLRKLGTKIGIKGKLTLYIARHSWATAARDNDVSISVISEALGHHSETTTQIYLRFIKSSEVDDANAKILAVL